MFKPVVNRAAKERELAMYGLTIEDYAAEEQQALGLVAVDVWPENEQAYYLLATMSSQWRVGPNGPIGFDYNVLNEVWNRHKIPEERRDELFMDLQVMEAAAIEQISENSENSATP